MEHDFKTNDDLRVAAIIRVLCDFYGLCDHSCCECIVSRELAARILNAADQTDRDNGIVRVPQKTGHTQLIAGLRCALKGESPSTIYHEMVKEGIKTLPSQPFGLPES